MDGHNPPEMDIKVIISAPNFFCKQKNMKSIIGKKLNISSIKKIKTQNKNCTELVLWKKSENYLKSKN